MKRTLLALAASALIILPAAGPIGVHAAQPRASTTIRVWEDFPAAALPQIQALANKWAATNGDTVKFVSTSQPGMGGGSVSVAGNLTLKAKNSDAADLAYTTEDGVGALVQSGIVAQRPASLLSAADLAKYKANAIGATMVNGVPYSVPQVVDGVALYYNKKFVKTPPTTWTQLISMAKPVTSGKNYGFLFDITGGLYYTYWAFNAYGGYVFGTKAGKPDATNIGLANAGSVQALTFLKSLTAIVPPTTDYNAADSNFSAGKVAMTINGPWQLAAYGKALGNNLGVATIPTLPNGKAAQTFIGVRVWVVNNFSKNQTAAWDLARYLSLNGQAVSGTYEGRLPSFKTVPGWQLSPAQVAFSKAFSIGVPMPNIPEMNSVWTPMNNAITLAVQGHATPQTALNAALQQIKAGIAKANQ
jgi:arabinogalactan oligomer / maltooligosaccharide transport system substrate-binding protein